jgi:hypothetical protein
MPARLRQLGTTSLFGSFAVFGHFEPMAKVHANPRSSTEV